VGVGTGWCIIVSDLPDHQADNTETLASTESFDDINSEDELDIISNTCDENNVISKDINITYSQFVDNQKILVNSDENEFDLDMDMNESNDISQSDNADELNMLKYYAFSHYVII
jgi:hypothetical protein